MISRKYNVFILQICVIEEDEDQLLTVPALKQQRIGYSAFFRLKLASQ